MKRILIIDDDPVFAKIYQSLFETEGYLVEVVVDAPAAMERLRTTQPDLVLLDLFLGRKNGVDVLKFIRCRAATRMVPVIALSNSTISRRIDAAWRAGADKFLAKENIDPEFLLETARSMIAAPRSAIDWDEAPSGLDGEPGDSQLRSEVLSVSPSGLSLRLEEYQVLRSELRDRFCREAAQWLGETRQRFEWFAKSGERTAQSDALMSLRQASAVMARDAGLLQFWRIERLATLLTMLFEDMREETQIPPGALQTAARAIDFLDELVRTGAEEHESELRRLVLIIDDEPVSRWAMGSAIELTGMSGISADTPALALQFVQENRFDLILLDWQMPGVNGIQLCEQIRGSAMNAEAAIAVVTGRTDFESRARSSLSGSDDFITKPFLLSELALRALLCVWRNEAARAERIGMR